MKNNESNSLLESLLKKDSPSYPQLDKALSTYERARLLIDRTNEAMGRKKSLSKSVSANTKKIQFTVKNNGSTTAF